MSIHCQSIAVYFDKYGSYKFQNDKNLLDEGQKHGLSACRLRLHGRLDDFKSFLKDSQNLEDFKSFLKDSHLEDFKSFSKESQKDDLSLFKRVPHHNLVCHFDSPCFLQLDLLSSGFIKLELSVPR